jgi:hypothetical protein
MLSMQVISGGQTGADLAGIRAAMMLGLRTGGYAPKGFRTLAGLKPSLASFGLLEHNGGYASRTAANVQASHATLVLAETLDSTGTALTLNILKELERPHHIVKIERTPQGFKLDGEVLPGIVTFINGEADKAITADGGFVLNIAGNSSQTAPGIFIPAFCICMQALARALSACAYDDESARQKLEGAMAMMQWTDPRQAHRLMDVFDYIPDLDPRNRRDDIITI